MTRRGSNLWHGRDARPEARPAHATTRVIARLQKLKLRSREEGNTRLTKSGHFFVVLVQQVFDPAKYRDVIQ